MAEKKQEQTDVLESSEALAGKLESAEHWIERHPKTFFAITGALLLAVGGYFGFRFWVDNQEAEAQKEMFQAVFYYESDSLDLALNGDGNNLGFIAISEDYSLTKAGNLANFYAGASYLKQGKFPLAIHYLEGFSSDDLLIQARAYCLLGDAHMEQKEFSDASKFYVKAAEYKPNKFFSPGYWMKAALAFEMDNQRQKAIEAYQQVIDLYWESAEYQSARKFKAMLEGQPS
jgi:TolA-binding protein